MHPEPPSGRSSVTVIRLVPADAERYTRLRLRMLTSDPWSFGSSPEDDVNLDPAHVAVFLAERDSAVLAVDEPVRGVGPGATSLRSRPPELIAAAGIRREKKAKHAHRAGLWGVFVEPSYRRAGLGRKVVQAAIDLARTWEGVDYVDLGVSENAPGALHLYESLGFRAWGREPEATQLGDRRYGEIHMTLRL